MTPGTLTLLSLVPFANAQAVYERRAPCDIPTPILTTVPADDVEACEQACTATAGCGAYTFVSGWDRCKLHAPTDRHVAVRILAGVVANGVALTPAPDHDHTGKDLERAPRDLPEASACAAACVATTGCVGYSYVEGYRSCWLKQTEGALVPKTFACGHRPTE